MLNFRKLKLGDKDWITDAVRAGDTDGSSYSFGTLYAWGDSYNVEVAGYDGLVLIRGTDECGRYYVYPSGKGDVKGAINAMIEDSHKDGYLFRFVLLLEKNKETVESLFPGLFDFSYDRDSSEYVYSVENMANLPGKKFHGKKGHVNAFFRNHEDVHVDPITEDNIHLCLEIQKQWIDEKTDDEGMLEKENIAIEKAVKNFTRLGFEGAILFADGKPVAFTMGEPLKNNTFCTHYEKTIPEYRDAFPVINNGFTKLMLLGYDHVNREEDTGAPGLRKAKLSYYPEYLLDKYSATLKNDTMRKYYVTEDDYPGLISLWQNVFGDRTEDIEFFIKNALTTDDIYAYKAEGRVVSALYLADATLIKSNENKKIKYLYAAATDPSFRKQGIMRDMIKYAADITALKGYHAIVLCPADAPLYDFYNKSGFETCFTDRIYTLSSDYLEKFRGGRYFNTNLSYSRIRESIPCESYIEFSNGYLAYARKLAAHYGFEINAAFDDEDSVFIIGHKKDGIVYIDEAISADGNYSHILSVIADINAEKVILKTPACITIDDAEYEDRPSGMMLLCEDSELPADAYLGQPCM